MLATCLYKWRPKEYFYIIRIISLFNGGCCVGPGWLDLWLRAVDCLFVCLFVLLFCSSGERKAVS